MKVSAVITTYNRLALLQKALKSVFAQSRTVDEIIIVDDASTDGTFEYLQSIESLFVFKNEVSVGGPASRNLGIEKATGDLIAFLDDDDVWESTKIEKQLSALEKGNADVVYTGTRVVNEHSVEQGRCFHRALFSPRVQICFLNYIGITSTVMVKRSFLLSEKFALDMPALQEYELFIRLIKGGAKAIGIDEPLVDYLQISESSTISAGAKKNFIASKLILKKHGKGIYFFLHILGLIRIFLQKYVHSAHFRKEVWSLILPKKKK